MENQGQSNKGSSIRWNDSLNRIFIQLCNDEIGKGNRPNNHFNVSGWNSLIKRFNEKTGSNIVYKQIRNHWDAMKKDWLLFKKLMHSETGIGWNPLNNSIDASEEWWIRKISENVEYKKFKNKDLSLVWFEYDQLFSDIDARGERARVPSQRSGNDVENEILEVDGETNQVEPAEIGDSDDIIGLTVQETSIETHETSGMGERVMFPSLDSVKRKYSGESSKKKRKNLEQLL